MNKWFASARDLSDSESSESSGDEDKKISQQQQQTATAKKGGAQPRRQYMKGFDHSSESEEENRVMKTTKDKRLDSLNNLLSELRNHLKINDFGQIMTDFEKLTENLEKNQSTGIIFEAGKDGILPNKILRVLVKIEDAINDTSKQTKEKKVTLSKTNSVSLNKLKQKLKKYLQTTGPSDNNYEQQIAKFREAPVWSEDERKAAAKKDTKKTAKVEQKKKKRDEDESEEEESEEQESEEEESEEEEEEEESEESEDEIDIFKVPREQLTPAQRRLKWVKKDRLPAYLQQQLASKQHSKQKEVDEKKQIAKDKGAEEAKQLQNALGMTGQSEKEAKETILNLKNDFQIDYCKHENVYKKLKEIQEEKMKGKYDPRYHSQILTYMLEQAKESRQKIEIVMNLLNSLFDTAKFTATGYLNRDVWIRTHNHLQTLVQLLSLPQIKDALLAHQLKEDKQAQTEEDSVDGAESTTQTADIERSILPSLVNFIEKLDNELLKAYQSIPHMKIEYLQRIRDENKLMHLCDSVQNQLQEFNDYGKVSRVAILKLDHLHYKNDTLYQKMKENHSNQNDTYIPEGDSRKVINDLVIIINSHGTSKLKLRAALFQIYHHSIHNRFHEAKDLLLKTHVSNIIHLHDIGSQIIYNRTITQIGMSAFRLGLIEESHDILVDICQTAKLREILAQGISRYIDKPIELEKEEQKRQVPFHLHINLQQLDCIYMISAMLLEISNIAENQFSVNKKIISKNFKKLIDQYDAKAFYLAPENYRDNIVYAAKQLNKSNWKQAIDHIFSIKLIHKMPEFAYQHFKDTLVLKFKETAIKAYLCRAAKSYSSFSIQSLSEIFELEKSTLLQIINKMIVKNKIQAHIDHETQMLVLESRTNEFKELQQLSLQYVEKLECMVENNERLIDMLAGGSLYTHKERTATEIQQINANRKQKLLMKAQNAQQLSSSVQAQRRQQ